MATPRKISLTALELAEATGLSYPVAAGLLTWLEEHGYAKVAGKRTHPTGRGKKTLVYEVTETVTIDLGTFFTGVKPDSDLRGISEQPRKRVKAWESRMSRPGGAAATERLHSTDDNYR